ncbi:Surfactin synthase thioesterase subunit [Prauserella aidingensis]|uniref:thioesterase II family protein n=1 Tax=Prauserella aidingensis TaxID=387890 RepID=UPI0020A5AF96|nr:thioesterase II family protein [Prauserella aidingensis]MCP2253999.1 Surfactin synthase thioesterase subunit [Prauserella aidingensis]
MPNANASDGSWIRRYHPSDKASARLVCLPHAGGSASYYFPVSAALTPDVEVLAVQYPGRQDRRSEPCFTTITDLADAVVAELDAWRDLPLVLFGHSMGATLGYEVARRLERAGGPPQALFASGRRAPSTHRDERIHTLDDEGIVDELRKLDGTHGAVLDDPELREMFLPVIRGDYTAVETYVHVPGTELSCPIHVLLGEDDPRASLDEAEAWAGHTDGEFSLTTFTGGHFYLDDHRDEVVSLVTERIAQLA